jgi:hypothetical protein
MNRNSMLDPGNEPVSGGHLVRRTHARRRSAWCATFIAGVWSVVIFGIGCAVLAAGTWSVRHGVWISESEGVRFKVSLASMPESYWQGVVSEAFEARTEWPFVIEGVRVRVNPSRHGEVASRLANVCVPGELSDLLQNGYLRSQSIQVSWRTGPLVIVLVAMGVWSVLLVLLVKLVWDVIGPPKN